jgi:asparagine synthetase B (glutamine-hydrolysing)
VLLSGEGADELMGGYTLQNLTTSISSACDLLGNFICFIKNHCTINCCAAQIQKKSDLVYLMVRISILKILQPLLE